MALLCVEIQRVHETTDYLAPRKCLLPPIPELQDAVELLDEAANALLADEFDRARSLLRMADMPVVHAYASRIMGRIDKDIHRYRPVRSIAAMPASATKTVQRMPSRSVERAIYQRDGYRCRFCGCPIVLGAARSAMRALIPDAIPWGRTTKDQHGAFFALTATLDHLVPHAKGGTNETDNLLTTCWPCNFGRGDALIEEIGLLDPRSRPPVIDGWDGLIRMLAHKTQILAPTRLAVKRSVPNNDAADIHARSRPAADVLSHQAWFDELNCFHDSASARLLRFLDECKELQISWKLNKILLVYVQAKDMPISVFGIERTGDVNVPWWIGPHKRHSRAFAEAIADAVPEAVAYESPKMWQVRKAGRKLTIVELLKAAPAIKAAFKELNLALMG